MSIEFDPIKKSGSGREEIITSRIPRRLSIPVRIAGAVSLSLAGHFVVNHQEFGGDNAQPVFASNTIDRQEVIIAEQNDTDFEEICADDYYDTKSRSSLDGQPADILKVEKAQGTESTAFRFTLREDVGNRNSSLDWDKNIGVVFLDSSGVAREMLIADGGLGKEEVRLYLIQLSEPFVRPASDSFNRDTPVDTDVSERLIWQAQGENVVHFEEDGKIVTINVPNNLISVFGENFIPLSMAGVISEYSTTVPISDVCLRPDQVPTPVPTATDEPTPLPTPIPPAPIIIDKGGRYHFDWFVFGVGSLATASFAAMFIRSKMQESGFIKSKVQAWRNQFRDSSQEDQS